jgi:hypothetical protein
MGIVIVVATHLWSLLLSSPTGLFSNKLCFSKSSFNLLLVFVCNAIYLNVSYIISTNVILGCSATTTSVYESVWLEKITLLYMSK